MKAQNGSKLLHKPLLCSNFDWSCAFICLLIWKTNLHLANSDENAIQNYQANPWRPTLRDPYWVGSFLYFIFVTIAFSNLLERKSNLEDFLEFKCHFQLLLWRRTILKWDSRFRISFYIFQIICTYICFTLGTNKSKMLGCPWWKSPKISQHILQSLR